MSDISIKGCPAPENITFVQRLKPLVGRTVTVYGTGIPKPTKTTGILSNLTRSSFKVGKTTIAFKTSFFIVLNQPVRRIKPFRVTATAEDIAPILKGKLIRVGRNFVEFVQTPGRRVPTIFPLNLFTEVTCTRKRSVRSGVESASRRIRCRKRHVCCPCRPCKPKRRGSGGRTKS